MSKKQKLLWKKVSSSNVEKACWMPGDLMYVTFKRNGAIYWYFPVPQQLFEKCMNAPSFGSVFIKKIQKNKNIRYGKATDVE